MSVFLALDAQKGFPSVNAFKSKTATDQSIALQDAATAALSLYSLPPDACVTLVNVSENATYRNEGRRWALRVHRHGYLSAVAILSELAWLMALRDADIAITPRPVVGLNGEILQRQSHRELPGPQHVVLYQPCARDRARFECAIQNLRGSDCAHALICATMGKAKLVPKVHMGF